MVLTADQKLGFFDDQTKTLMHHTTRVKLQSEGIATPDDLVEFNEEVIKVISDNLNRLRKRTP